MTKYIKICVTSFIDVPIFEKGSKVREAQMQGNLTKLNLHFEFDFYTKVSILKFYSSPILTSSDSAGDLIKCLNPIERANNMISLCV